MQSSKRPISAALRGALWITLIALLTTGLALTLQYVQTTRLIETSRRAAVDDEAASLVQRYRDDGLEGLAQAIRQQQDVTRIHEFFYLLASPDGAPLAGNLVSWPDVVTQTGFHSFDTDVVNTRGQTVRRRFEARAVQLDGGVRLLVGNFSDQRDNLRERYLSALIWSFAATGIVGLALGWWLSRRGLNFVRDVSDAGEKFLSGRLAERLPVSARGDEYDRLAETINRCFGEVERLIGSLRAATDGLAHDLKTPLTRIRARLELAEMQDEATGPLHLAAEESRQDLDDLLVLINDMLSLARAETTPADQFVAVDLGAIVAEALEIFQPVAEEKGLRFDVEIESVSVWGLAALLARLIANLLDNAVKYGPPGSVLSVRLTREINAALLMIADQGEGIAPERHDHALRRFGRLDESRSTPGNGLGLSIVDAVARVHEAELRLGDNGPGLRVELRFPLNR